MYKKNKKVNDDLIDNRLYSFCNDLLKYNDDSFFIISKKFVENNGVFEEIKQIPVIISSTEIERLLVPSGYKIIDNCYLTTWCDVKRPLARLEHKNIIFKDGDINDKKVKNLFMVME